MAPATRSGRNAGPSTSQTPLTEDIQDTSDRESIYGSQTPTKRRRTRRSVAKETSLESLLTRALGGARELERENDALRKKVEALETRLDRVVEPDDAPLLPRRSKKAPETAAQLRTQVAQLRKQVERLQKSNEKNRKKVHQLSMKELKAEAQDLVDVADFEVGDTAHKMRKLLRRFHDLMLENSLEEDEECQICMERLQPKKSRSFPCQHTVCDDCVRKLIPEPGQPDAIRCPQCRKICYRHETEVVEHTAAEQWDALLEVAYEWAGMDSRREEDTTEEEDAEEFIDDGGIAEESSATASEAAPADSVQHTPDPADSSQMSSRLRKRQVVASPPPEDEEADTGESSIHAGDENGGPAASTANQVNKERSDTPPLPHTPTTNSPQRSPSYSQSPVRDKRKTLERLAEARNKKRRH